MKKEVSYNNNNTYQTQNVECLEKHKNPTKA